MERKGKASRSGKGEAPSGKYEERDGVKLELSTAGIDKSLPEVKQDIPVMARFLSDELTDRDRKKMEREFPKKRCPLPGVLKFLLLVTFMAAASVIAFLSYGYFRDRSPSEDPGEAEGLPAQSVEGIVSENDLKAEGTVTILSVDKNNKVIRFAEPESGEEYVLNMADYTVYEDYFGNPMVPDQLKTGDIVDIVVSIHSSSLASVKENKDENAFELRDITDYDISPARGIFTYDDRNYRILEGTTVFSGGEISSFKKLKAGDVLTVRGIGSDIYTVMQTGGNGHVRIRGAESFKGGWIEIGGIIKPIDGGEMLFTVPEGEYVLSVSYQHFGGTKNVTVTRGRETKADVSDLKGDLLKTGKITFSFEPLDADPDVFIDGKKINKTEAFETDYGVHTLDVKAEGYVTIHKFLSVGQPMANLAIILEKDEESTASANSSDKNTGKKAQDKEKDTVSAEAPPETFKADGASSGSSTTGSSIAGSSTTGSSSSKTDDVAVGTGNENDAGNGGTGENQGNPGDTETVTTDVSQLYIDGPEGVEVYYDGAYKGIAPCHFRKNGGTHVITLMQNGHETKSYTLNLSSGTENEAYSFNELIEEHDA